MTRRQRRVSHRTTLLYAGTLDSTRRGLPSSTFPGVTEACSHFLILFFFLVLPHLSPPPWACSPLVTLMRSNSITWGYIITRIIATFDLLSVTEVVSCSGYITIHLFFDLSSLSSYFVAIIFSLLSLIPSFPPSLSLLQT